MRTTRAYIASAGTAAVMLGASVVMLVLVSTFVAFGSWPGSDSGKQVDQVVLRDVTASAKAKPKAVPVRADAVQVARRAEARRQVAAVRRGGGRSGGTRTRSNTPGGTTLPNGDTVAQAPTGGGTRGGTVLPTGTSSPTQQVQQVQQVQQQTQQTLQNTTDAVQNTTTQVTNQVQQQVQDTTQQVGEVVDQVVGGTQQTTTGTVNTVTNTVGGILGK